MGILGSAFGSCHGWRRWDEEAELVEKQDYWGGDEGLLLIHTTFRIAVVQKRSYAQIATVGAVWQFRGGGADKAVLVPIDSTSFLPLGADGSWFALKAGRG